MDKKLKACDFLREWFTNGKQQLQQYVPKYFPWILIPKALHALAIMKIMEIDYQYAVHQQLFVGFQSFYDSFKKVINWAAKNCRFNKKLLITPSIAVFYNLLWCILQLCTNPEL
jgi:hypothetical protein